MYGELGCNEPGLRDDYVIDGSMPSPESSEPDPDYHNGRIWEEEVVYVVERRGWLYGMVLRPWRFDVHARAFLADGGKGRSAGRDSALAGMDP
jgi:hypothetical protein